MNFWTVSIRVIFAIFCLLGLSACTIEASLKRELSSEGNLTYSPSIQALGLPYSKIHLNRLKTPVSGTDISAYKFKLGLAGSTDCDDLASYSSEISTSTKIDEALPGDDVEYRVCIIGKSLDGTWQSPSEGIEKTFYKDSRQKFDFGYGDSFEISAVFGSRLYVSRTSSGFSLYDFSDPTAPSFLASYDTDGDPKAFYEYTQRLYVADWDGGLTVFDVSNSSKIRLIAKEISVRARTLIGAGSLLIVGLNTETKLYDISTATPNLIATIPYGADALDVQGSYLYFFDTGDNLRIYDISTPASPVAKGTFNSVNGQYPKLDVDGGFLYLTETTGTRIIDVSDVNNPTQVSTVAAGRSVAANGSILYVGQVSNIKAYDISNKASPNLAQTVVSRHWEFHLSGNYLINGGGDFLEIYNASGPLALEKKIASIGANGFLGLRIENNVLYGADENGLVILNTTNKVHSELMSVHAESSGAGYEYVEKAGDIAVVANSDKVDLINVSNTAAPQFISTIAQTNIKDIAVAGTTLYVLLPDTLISYDISSPASPVLLDSFNIVENSAVKMAYAEGYLHVVLDSSTVAVMMIDISNPANLIRHGSISSSLGGVESVDISGNLVFIAAGGDGVGVFDVSNKDAPSYVGAYHTSLFAQLGYDMVYGVHVSGGYLYVAAWDIVAVFEISNSGALTAKGSFDFAGTQDGSIWTTFKEGAYLYIADMYHGLRLLNVADPDNLEQK